MPLRTQVQAFTEGLGGQSLLHNVAGTGHLDCVELLLAAGADVNARNKVSLVTQNAQFTTALPPDDNQESTPMAACVFPEQDKLRLITCTPTRQPRRVVLLTGKLYTFALRSQGRLCDMPAVRQLRAACSPNSQASACWVCRRLVEAGAAIEAQGRVGAGIA
jgi:hypothetical protein